MISKPGTSILHLYASNRGLHTALIVSAGKKLAPICWV